MFSAYLCGHARPPVTTEHTHISRLRRLHKTFTLQKAHESDIYREKVHGWLWGVHDEVAKGESEPLGSSTQQHRFGSRPRELLFWWELHRRGAGQAPPIWGFILREKAARGEVNGARRHLHWRVNWVQSPNWRAVTCVLIRGHARALICSVNMWPVSTASGQGSNPLLLPSWSHTFVTLIEISETIFDTFLGEIFKNPCTEWPSTAVFY